MLYRHAPEIDTMTPKHITLQALRKILQGLQADDESSIGSYLYHGFHIQVSRYHLPTSERVSLLYRRRREQGLCVVCGNKVMQKNPRTGSLYRLCQKHRRKLDKK